MADLDLLSEHRYFVVFAAVGIALAGFVYRVKSSPLAKIPGPWYAKWTSLVLTYHWLGGSRTQYVHSLHQKYGHVVLISPSEVDTTDVAATKEIHSFKGGWVKSSFYRSMAAPGVENVFNTVDVAFHRRHRRLLQGPFSETNLKVFHSTVEQRIDLAIQRMREEMHSRGAADVFKWWFFMATDVIGELTFGESFRMLELGKPNDYTANLQAVGRIGAIRSTFPSLSSLAMSLPLPFFTKVVESSKAGKQYAEESLQRHQRLIEDDSTSILPTLFTNMFKGKEEETLTFNEIRDEGIVYIVAGSDTTAITLTYLVWSVCRNSHIQTQLVAELGTLAPDYKEKDLHNLPYLNQVIDETLRLHSAAPSGLPRVSPPGGATLGGYWVPCGTEVSTQAYSLHRNPEMFPEPEKFDPSRWANPTKAMRDSYMPFGGGSRVCLGIHLAKLELRLAVARFFLAFPNARGSTLEGMCHDEMEPDIFFLVSPKGKRCLVECF